MSRQEAINEYSKALKTAKKNYKDCINNGKYPYLQILDEILDESLTAGQVDIGLVDIPIDQIAGTKTEGRKSAFSSNFMPLLDANTEFANKWITLCQAQLGDEGIKDPIRCYEYMGRFYVQEGNKRVSVLKALGAHSILGYVVRIVPALSDDKEVLAYYDFMKSYPLTKLYQTRFSKEGSFPKLQLALGFDIDHYWTTDERRHFLAGYTWFSSAYSALNGNLIPITVADALLVWLKVYSFEDLFGKTSNEIEKMLQAIWPDIKSLAQEKPIEVNTQIDDENMAQPGIIDRFFNIRPSHLNIAFINEFSPDSSDWVRAHDLGRKYLEAVMGDKISVESYNNVTHEENEDDVFELAVNRGAEVIFATTPSLIGGCRKTAAKHPEVRVMNCSIEMPYAGVRTYYNRIYEGKFITGAIAGALSKNGKIGYVASAPIFGVPASINAFALGAQMTNPNAAIHLRWSCVDADVMNGFAKDGFEIVSNRDVPTPDRMNETWGLCKLSEDKIYRTIASPYCHWGNFYVRLVKSIFSGTWDMISTQDGKAVNYWWGLKSNTTGLLLSEMLPLGVNQLAEYLEKGIVDELIHPFQRKIYSQDGTIRNEGHTWLSLDDILHMDWLCDNVEGSIPGYDELLPMARANVRLQGLYRDWLNPEKEDAIL